MSAARRGLFETAEVDSPNVVIEAGDERLLDVGVDGATTFLFRDRALECQ